MPRRSVPTSNVIPRRRLHNCHEKIEIVCSLVALNDGFLPPTINLDKPDPACDLDYVPNASRSARVPLFLSNSFGFGGMNGVVAVRTIHGL